VVSQIVNSDGTVVENIAPRILKQTVSETTSNKIIELCNAVVAEGTGKTARPAGYAIGGKTGTAETLPRGEGNYVVSFMGYAPANDPQIAIYVVIDEPNVERQDSAKYATGVVRSILTEVLPYLNIFMTEELSEDEVTELSQMQYYIPATTPVTTPTEGTAADGTTTEGTTADGTTTDGTTTDGSTAEEITTEETAVKPTKVESGPIEGYAIDPETGYAIDPVTGKLLDPATGEEIKESSSFMD
jgi:stage V sporulation protein D (sporulation-specific penicillin-binding protein)